MSKADAIDQRLRALPAGSNVAVVSLLGSLCPITLGHVQTFVEARQVLLRLSEHPVPARLEEFAECVGFICLNTDRHVDKKMSAAGQSSLDYSTRQYLVELAIEDHDWVYFHPTRQGHEQREEEREGVRQLSAKWPQLHVVHFYMNGADDVVKCRKYTWSCPHSRFITMGRPGFTEEVREGMAASGVDPDDGFFIIGPELPDISSTAVRAALASGNYAALEGIVHPKVAKWCIDSGAFSVNGGVDHEVLRPVGCVK